MIREILERTTLNPQNIKCLAVVVSEEGLVSVLRDSASEHRYLATDPGSEMMIQSLDPRTREAACRLLPFEVGLLENYKAFLWQAYGSEEGKDLWLSLSWWNVLAKEDTDPPRCRMVEGLRTCLHGYVGAEELARYQAAHARFFLSLLRARDMSGLDDDKVEAEVVQERDNLTVAARWMAKNRSRITDNELEALNQWRYWLGLGRSGDVDKFYEKVIQTMGKIPFRILPASAMWSYTRAEYEKTILVCREYRNGRKDSFERQDLQLAFFESSALGMRYYIEEENAYKAEAYEALELCRSIAGDLATRNDRGLVHHLDQTLCWVFGLVERRKGNKEAEHQLLDQGISAGEKALKLVDRGWLLFVRNTVAHLYRQRAYESRDSGLIGRSHELYMENINRWADTGRSQGVAAALLGSACLANSVGKNNDALVALKASEKFHRIFGWAWLPPQDDDVNAVLKAADAQLTLDEQSECGRRANSLCTKKNKNTLRKFCAQILS